MKQAKRPIILSTKCTNAYLNPGEPILLHSNGTLSCGDKVVPDRTRGYYLRQYYKFFSEYLTKKKLPLDVSHFREKDLGDIVSELQNLGKKSISLKKLLDIYSFQNQIAKMREIAIERIERVERARWQRIHRKALDSSNYDKVQEMGRELEQKRGLVHEILNLRV